jgi:hypothetical protein
MVSPGSVSLARPAFLGWACLSTGLLMPLALGNAGDQSEVSR